MNEFLLTKNRIIALLLAGAIIFAVLTAVSAQQLNRSQAPLPAITSSPAITSPATAGFQVVRTEPNISEPVSTQPTLRVYFNKSIKDAKVGIRLEPAVDLNISTDISNTVLVAEPKVSLRPNTDYQVSVFIEETKFYQWSFKTQGSVIANSQATVIAKIKTQLPYQGSHFRILYDAVLDEFQVIIDDKPIDSYYQQALVWLREQGLVDLTGVKISRYVVGRAARP